ncbi:MAG: paraquat-inducible protein A, partial [Gammaproteobacteria bacterium]|nr:paraquat-inducible protein A [Gammaproteobacteria bacterium]
VACHECDLLHHRRTLANGSTARCRRCHAVLYRHVDGVKNLEQLLALTVAALILYVAANLLPFLTIDLNGQQQQISLVSGVLALFSGGMWILAGFSFVLILLVPQLRLLSLLSLLWMVHRGHRLKGHLKLFHLLEWLRPWSMMEIYLLGALVTMVKLASVATLLLGAAFWAFAALIVISSWISSRYDGEHLCQALNRIR